MSMQLGSLKLMTAESSIMRAGGPLKLIEPEEIPPYVWPLASSTSAKL